MTRPAPYTASTRTGLPPRRALVAALATTALALAACGSSSDDDEVGVVGGAVDDAAPVTLEQVATVPVPEPLTAPTGIVWHAPSTSFVVVTDSGQIATIDGESFAARGVIASGLDSLADVTAGADGSLLAADASGTLVDLSVDAGGAPVLGESVTVTTEGPLTGVALADELDGPGLLVDTATGPTVFELEDGIADEVLRLDGGGIERSAALALAGGERLVVADAASPRLVSFGFDGRVQLELRPEGLSTIEGVTVRGGTIIVAGRDVMNAPTFAAYDFDSGETIDPDPAAGPATLAATLPRAGESAWPEAVRQPSGLAWEPASASWVVATDQGEFFSLSEDFAEVRQRIALEGFGQGEIEDLHLAGAGRVLVVAEDGGYVPITLEGDTWRSGAYVENPAVDVEVSAIGYRSDEDALYYIANAGVGRALIVTTPDGRLVARRPIDTSAIGIDSLDGYTVASLFWTGEEFLVLSERYATVFAMGADGVVRRAWGLADAVEPSGLALRDGTLHVASDHEDSEPVPPVARYRLPDAP